jgi:tetratricopeptide (TPR) repeat protein
MERSTSDVQKARIASAWRDIALDLIRAKRYVKAWEILKKAVDNKPDDVLSLTLLGGLKVWSWDQSFASEYLGRAQLLDPGNVIISRLQATECRLCAQEIQYFDFNYVALSYLDRAIERDPDDLFSLILRGDIHMLRKKYANADADLLQAEALTGVPLKFSFIIVAMRGGCKRMLGELEEASRLLQSAYNLWGNNIFVLKSYGDVLNRLGDYASAQVILRKARNLVWNDAVSLALLGETTKLSGNCAQALALPNAADRMKPNDAYILTLRGDIKRMRGDYEGALADLDRADAIERENEFTLKIRGSVKGRLGRLEEALLDLNRVLIKTPNDGFAYKRRHEVQREKTWGCISGVCRRICEVIKRVRGQNVEETKLFAPLLDIKTSELCNLDKVIAEQTLAEMSVRSAVHSN